MPSVVGHEPGAAAVSTLQKRRLQGRASRRSTPNNFAQGFVSRQAPAAGTKLREGATVDIWVSKGSETVTLIDFTD